MSESIVAHIEAGVWPVVWDRLDSCFPELHLRHVGRRWQCQPEADEACRRLFGAAARRVASTRPGWFTIAGGESVSWTTALCGGQTVRGAQWRAAVGELGRRAGLDMAWTEGSSAHPTMSAELIEKHAKKIEAEARAQERKRLRKIADARALWQTHAGHAEGCAGYLAARGIDLSRLPGIPESLTYAEVLPYYRSEIGRERVRVLPDGPGILARVDDAGGDVLAVQRIYLEPGGERKRAEKAAKKVVGAPGGGAVRLRDPGGGGEGSVGGEGGVGGGTLIICEGVETGVAILAAVHPHNPRTGVWAALFGGNMLKIEIPEAIARDVAGIIIAGDHDEVCGAGHRPGLIYAHKAAARLAELHPAISVYVAIPDHALVPTMVDDRGALIAAGGVGDAGGGRHGGDL